MPCKPTWTRNRCKTEKLQYGNIVVVVVVVVVVLVVVVEEVQ